MLHPTHTAIKERGVSPSIGRWFILALCLLFVAQSVQYAFKASGNSEKVPGSAIVRWRDQLLHLRDEDIYKRYNYPNPPIMALLLEPIAHLPPLAGSLCWFYLKLGMTLMAVLWVFRLIENPQRPFPDWAKAMQDAQAAPLPSPAAKPDQETRMFNRIKSRQRWLLAFILGPS